MNDTPPPPSKNKEEKYSIAVQLIGFSIFWILPSLWISYIWTKLLDFSVNGILLWIGMVVLNLATYSYGRAISSNVNGYILYALLICQIYIWICL